MIMKVLQSVLQGLLIWIFIQSIINSTEISSFWPNSNSHFSSLRDNAFAGILVLPDLKNRVNLVDLTIKKICMQ